MREKNKSKRHREKERKKERKKKKTIVGKGHVLQENDI